MKISNNVNSPEWCRMPGNGQRLEGLSRATLYGLMADGEIKTACLRRKASLTGTRLIHLPTLRAYIAKHIETSIDPDTSAAYRARRMVKATV